MARSVSFTALYFIAMLPASLSFSTPVASKQSTRSIRPTFAISSRSFRRYMTDSSKIIPDDNSRLFEDARRCANEESCTLEEAEQYMNQMIGVEVACVSGSYNEECCDISWISDIERDLIQKIEMLEPSRALAEELERKRLDSLAAATQYWELSPLAAIAKPENILPALFISSLVILSLHSTGQDVSPFTVQEWLWAARDGYLGTMMSENIQHGGFVLGDVTPVSSFTLQEWMWAGRDGYLGNMISHNLHHGGLVAGDDVSSPFTMQEWFWAIKGGYVDDMFHHYLKNGGV
uniref:Uncharacterized protein n=1 Tax=Corethron hystrix TaxID=216773 RepID=A0A7S1BHD1_9STRA|mmetsp:Transcript_281/g.628  ORF Transcript_281/g.628 Transcript_281/m.628 type:complete len:291 (+) Transcript_281:192-1064(+)|eukprot:CAMPEP_0113316242 /NCGR_PEP_ID=MMETSP0010_2-20120614/11588_1 /TAXON_ID=216773 ORGANISM="Corethron hystrix, Strain 308" /NCGR_SAMPLE_ID=MMETSP0010_2 /ASSEMBLY_ACC=CAM_ASM_000155 /LENGTH=290 /DNA_ID=CAMNT_0000172903 /DNA_START=63 /DNA_END=935 /DNA_ORIENTATION=+ /assembly_acc=CAM_ASM_000155